MTIDSENSGAAPTVATASPEPKPVSYTHLDVYKRQESGWWDGDDARRDYYVIRTAQGQRAWVFCAPGERGPYLLHGWFA